MERRMPVISIQFQPISETVQAAGILPSVVLPAGTVEEQRAFLEAHFTALLHERILCAAQSANTEHV